MIVLVGYATEHGSTREIAQRIGSGLRAAGVDAHVRSLTDVGDVRGYGAFVVGSAVHDRSWLDTGREFVRRDLARTRSRPVWLFSVGMPDALRGPWRRLAATEASAIEADLAAPFPVRGHRLFSGVVGPEHLSRAGRLVFRLMGGRYGDHRDEGAIDAWAASIAEELGHR
ncbi:flavodoxin domain-containing protein [Nocardiopsis baichengensis]|uniref:flavodoxin domain-containing protein n=1 Tax=Nocardiopsis baichengensis TaxID=280240 RepID=UPI000348552A|nr:flavodoxin domain-containing protein [Nocardiopsis baichengensis]